MAEKQIDPKFNIHSNYTNVHIINPYRFNGGGVNHEPETVNLMASIGWADDNTISPHNGLTYAEVYTKLDTYFASLKAENILSKLKAVYLFIGNNADNHKWNAVNPQDTDAAFRMLWYGSGIYSATGFKGNGTNAYGDTNFNQLNNSELNNESFGIYSRSNINGNYIASGINASKDTYIYLNLDGLSYVRSQSNINQLNFTVSDSLGFYQVSNFDNKIIARKNDFEKKVNNNGQALENFNFYLGARNGAGNAELFANNEFSYYSIFKGMTEAQMLAHNNAVQQLQIDLGRAV